MIASHLHDAIRRSFDTLATAPIDRTVTTITSPSRRFVAPGARSSALSPFVRYHAC
jgi:hypothetical protein